MNHLEWESRGRKAESGFDHWISLRFRLSDFRFGLTQRGEGRDGSVSKKGAVYQS